MRNSSVFKMSNILALFGWTFLNVQIAAGNPASHLRSPRIDVVIHLDQLVQNKSETELAEISVTNSSGGGGDGIILRKRQDDAGLGNVAEIVAGVLGGGLGNIFEGSSGFIGNSAVQEEVQFVLNNVAPSLDVVLKYGWEGFKRYFGIGVTTPAPVVVVQHIYHNQTALPMGAIIAPQLQQQSVITTTTTEEDPEAAKNDNVDYPLLSRSRVG